MHGGEPREEEEEQGEGDGEMKGKVSAYFKSVILLDQEIKEQSERNSIIPLQNSPPLHSATPSTKDIGD